jgi:hypothetical protein
MNPQDGLDRTLAAWFHEDAAATEPIGFGERVDEAVRRSRQRPAWRATLRQGAFADLPRAVDADRGIITAILLALLTLLLLATGLLVAGQPWRPAPVPPVPADRGTFSVTGSMAYAREQPSATLLRDGRVLVIGGWPMVGPAEIWDPLTGAFSPAGSLVHARWAHTATLLDDGRVLVVGGHDAADSAEASADPGTQSTPVTVAELWDPVTLSFRALASPSSSRFKGSAEVLSDGRVLISGGDAGVPSEVWDPTTEAFTPAGSEVPARPDGTLLADGRVLTSRGTMAEDPARVWEPVTMTYESAGVPPRASSYGVTSTLLADGRVLLVGGDGAADSAEVWDPVTLTSGATGSPVQRRARHTAVLLADGRVLDLGDDVHFNDATFAEVFALR